MKAFLILAAITVLASVQALTDEQREKIKNYHTECAKLTGVNQELINKARNGEFVDDPKLKEQLFCFSKKAGFQNDAGDIQVDILKAKLSPEVKNEDKVKEFVSKCAVKKATPQETAYDTMKCYYESTPNHVSLF